MKTLSKEERKAVAADIFKRYNKAEKVAVTSDGMAFIVDDSDNAVKNHAKNNRYKKELEYNTFTRESIEQTAKPADKGKKTVKELVADIEAATEVAAVEALLAAENEGEKRKGVIEAADKRIKELKPE